MLSKNHWVRPFLAFFRFVREILFVTVALDHPVLGIRYFLPIMSSSPNSVFNTVGQYGVIFYPPLCPGFSSSEIN